MVVTTDVKLPKEEELTVDEVNLSATTLMAAGPFVGKECEDINTEFLLCRQESEDPRACLILGKRVTACALESFRRIKRECLEEFKQYVNCIDKSSGDYSFRYCRKTQAVFDGCMKDRLCIDRPDFGYFCRGRIHKTSTPAPKPGPCPCHPKVPDPTPGLDDCEPRPPARFGGRFYWFND